MAVRGAPCLAWCLRRVGASCDWLLLEAGTQVSRAGLRALGADGWARLSGRSLCVCVYGDLVVSYSASQEEKSTALSGLRSSRRSWPFGGAAPALAWPPRRAARAGAAVPRYRPRAHPGAGVALTEPSLVYIFKFLRHI